MDIHHFMLDRNAKEDEKATSHENSLIQQRKMDKKTARWNPCFCSATRTHEAWEDRGRDGRMTLTNLSNEMRRKVHAVTCRGTCVDKTRQDTPRHSTPRHATPRHDTTGQGRSGQDRATQDNARQRKTTRRDATQRNATQHGLSSRFVLLHVHPHQCAHALAQDCVLTTVSPLVWPRVLSTMHGRGTSLEHAAHCGAHREANR